MNSKNQRLDGLWLPLITPFQNGEIDELSFRRLLQHYATEPINGFILAATTGEELTLEEREIESLSLMAREELSSIKRDLPIYVGVSGSDTRRMGQLLYRRNDWLIDGYLVSCPHYSRPQQKGLFQHFSHLADQTDKPIIIYNIPYRTGVNMANDTLLQLAEVNNIIGVKDCCAVKEQSLALMANHPIDFSVLTGEDDFILEAVQKGASGAISASAHIHTSAFANTIGTGRAGKISEANRHWQQVVQLPKLIFAEVSVAAIKHWLWKAGLINSQEVRLPLTPVSSDLARRIEIERAKQAFPQ